MTVWMAWETVQPLSLSPNSSHQAKFPLPFSLVFFTEEHSRTAGLVSGPALGSLRALSGLGEVQVDQNQ